MEQTRGDEQGGLLIRATRPDEIEQVVSILEEAAQWLTTRGIHQWPPGGFSADEVLHWQQVGIVLPAWHGATAIGTITVTFHNEDLWQSMPPIQAGYVAKLAVRREVAGQDVGVQLLHAAENVARERGCAVVRLDCWAGNAALRRFYTEAGFTLRGIVAEETWECALFEKALA